MKTKFGENGESLDPVYEKRATGFLDQLNRMSRALCRRRENPASKHHGK